MDFGFFRAASRGSFRLIASNESGAARQIEIPAGRTTRVGALAGETFEVIDPSTAVPSENSVHDAWVARCICNWVTRAQQP